MRLNLSFKFFIAFLATSFTIVAVMVVAMQLYAYQNFSDYIHKVESIRLSELSPILGREYQAGNGWERLRDDPRQWHELLRPLHLDFRGPAGVACLLFGKQACFYSFRAEALRLEFCGETIDLAPHQCLRTNPGK